MLRILPLCEGAGLLAVGALLLSSALAYGADRGPSSLADQLADLGSQARQHGRAEEAATYYRKALKLDPNHTEARRALADPAIAQVAMLQDPEKAADPKEGEAPAPAADTPPPAPAPGATLENAAALEKVLTERLTAATHERLQRAKELLDKEQPEAALTTLRLAREAVRSDDSVPSERRNALLREVETAIQTTVRREEDIQLAQAERLRRAQFSGQRARVLEDLATNQETATTLMIEFNALMSQGHYNVLFNGGMGDIVATTAPFITAMTVAREARAIEPDRTAPRAGVEVAHYEGFLAQSLAYEELK